MSIILYGCDSWLNVSLKLVETMYIKAVKALPGVRITTLNNLCLIEAGFKPLSRIVKSHQKKFFTKMVKSRSDIFDDPFMHSLKVTQELHKSMWKYIDSTMKGGYFVSEEVARFKGSIINSDTAAMKFQTYRALNPNLDPHSLYTNNAPVTPDYLRLTFARYRLSSHRLRIKMGRWSRTPRDERICACGAGIQDEFHIFQCSTITDLFSDCSKTYNSLADVFLETTCKDLHVLHCVLNHLYAERQKTEPFD